MQRETNKIKTKLPSECQQETNEKKKENKKAAKLQRENKTDFVKRDYYHILKWSKPKTKQGLFYFNKYQPWNNVAQCHANLEKDLCYYSSY